MFMVPRELKVSSSAFFLHCVHANFLTSIDPNYTYLRSTNEPMLSKTAHQSSVGSAAGKLDKASLKYSLDNVMAPSYSYVLGCGAFCAVWLFGKLLFNL